MTTHTWEQGVRLHYLANLGGLMAVAQLDDQPPDLLLGVLLEVAERLPHLSPAQVAALRARGHERLTQRGAEKRAWKAWARAEELRRLDLRPAEIARLIRALGGEPPPRDQEAAPRLLALLRGKDGA